MLTILWGAWVRISHSGDGCGNNWPLCNQTLLPQNVTAFIEWFHRLTSGLTFLLVLALLILSFKIYPPKHIVRKLALFSFLFIFIEACIGAVLVLNQLVGFNQSSLRVFVLIIHFINSLLLVGALTLCFKATLLKKIELKKYYIYLILFFLAIGLTGNIASLAGSLFPTQNLWQAFLLDFAETSHITVKLRPFHPFLAVTFLVLLMSLVYQGYKKLQKVAWLASLTVLVGVITLALLSPVGLKILHLLMAYLVWIALVQSSFKSNP